MSKNRYQEYKSAYYRHIEEKKGIDYIVKNRKTLKKDFDNFAKEIFGD